MDWKIANLEHNVADGGVVTAHWRCTLTEEDKSVGSYGTVSFTPDPSASDFVPYENLTEEVVLTWVFAEVNKEEVETSLTTKLEAEKNPTVTAGLPW